MVTTVVPEAVPAASAGVRLASDLDVLGAEEVEALRAANFARTVAAARAVEAVSARYPELAEVRTPADLPRMPILTPAALAAGSPPRSTEFLLGPDGGMVLRSSGTAGEAKTMFHSWEFKHQVDTLGMRGLRALLPDPPRRLANCMYPGNLNGAFMFVLGLAERLGALAFPLGSIARPEETAAVIAAHQVDTIVASPAYGTEVLTCTPADQLRSLRHFLYLGEAIGQERERLVAEALPDVTVRSVAYSTNETGPIGYQCARQSGATHHIHEDAVIVEVVDQETGRPVPDGEVGELLITPLKDTGMALFRYRIGDRARIETAPCACGSAARLLTLMGRAGQSATIDVWTISADQLLAALRPLGVSDISQCQLQILWDFPRYAVRLLLAPSVPAGATPEAFLEQARAHFQLNAVLTGRRSASVTVEYVDLGAFAQNERGKVPVFYQRF
ncbi:phenylacetate--CoA ligase family protein [Micromonospora sp. KC723]|uniref:phenylacetate--CoA ligase family protein n=1 Tax=Micromonospora sp. KC723 TaxID=2530381 RepID=UPI001042D40C|nr:AMP-binding protein [Micromonospora sp. KC723]TDB78457.1 phenylacetate--CoA ligase family protein [Micromonospora sp. KC723]